MHGYWQCLCWTQPSRCVSLAALGLDIEPGYNSTRAYNSTNESVLMYLSSIPTAALATTLPAQVFYLDSLKFFLSLYGHKLPVICMDISSDSTLLVSGSADKNIKVSAYI